MQLRQSHQRAFFCNFGSWFLKKKILHARKRMSGRTDILKLMCKRGRKKRRMTSRTMHSNKFINQQIHAVVRSDGEFVGNLILLLSDNCHIFIFLEFLFQNWMGVYGFKLIAVRALFFAAEAAVAARSRNYP